MKKLFLLSFILISCKSTPPVAEKPDLCVTVVDPHLCLITIDKDTYAAYGENRCLALRKLKHVLASAGHNPLVSQRATCGRVTK